MAVHTWLKKTTYMEQQELTNYGVNFPSRTFPPPPPLDPSRPLGILVGHFLSSRMLALAGCAGKGDPTWLTIRHGEPHGVAGCAVFSANACKPTASMNTPYRSCAVVR